MDTSGSHSQSSPADDRRNVLLALLRKKWGYDSFRPLQLDIIESLLDGCDTIGLMPTGGGKSITFQLPGLYSDGLTLVITPLISLMKDQTDGLRRRRIRAVYFHAGMSSAEIRVAWETLVNGKAKFLYCSPERLKSERFCAELRHLGVSAIVIDEAHCISQWGYDFRPDYLNISKLRKLLPGVPALALTATATEEVITDIADKLDMKQWKLFRKSFRRENLSYIVRLTDNKDNELLHILTRTAGSAIVYVRSRKRTVSIAQWLTDNGVAALPYHAGLDFELKEEQQNKWMRGEVRVMVATNAFGMGIDKADVRVVIHRDFPPSPEEYYQEAGRGGRDGKPSYAVLLAHKRDRSLLRRRVEEAFPPRKDVKKLYELICDFLGVCIGEGYGRLYEFEMDTFTSRFKLDERFVRASLRLLGSAGYMILIDEVDMRSRAIIIVTREELYHIRGMSAEAERVLTYILRNYTGIFTDWVVIDELRIGRELNVDTRVVYEALIELRRAKIISYVPRRRVPYILLPTAREECRYVQIPVEVYEGRRDQMQRRVEAMIDYAFNSDSCRENRLTGYFGEQGNDDCGKCDVCRERRRKSGGSAPKPSFEQAVEEVRRRVAACPDGLPIAKATETFYATEHLLTEAARFLLTNDIIRSADGRYFLVEPDAQ